MITSADKLQIFEDFRVDRSLPKFKAETSGSNVSFANAVTFSDAVGVVWSELQPVGAPTIVRRSRAQGWLARVFARMVAMFARTKGPELSIPEFFASVKNTEQELSVVKERAEGYESAMIRARAAGQKALVEQLESGLAAHRAEAQLVALGLTRHLVEADVVNFYKKSPRGLRLDWLRNFTRLIPEAIVADKARADAVGVFDNYVVLHYDPEAKSYAETQAEQEARRDPILFGVIQGRRILYVIGDWIDELCDLTLDQVADTLGADAVRVLK